MRVEVVLFDLGGVLVELGGMGDMMVFADEPDHDEIWRRWLGCPWVRRFERGQCETHEFARGMVESWSMPIGPEAFLEAFARWPRRMLPGAKNLVRAVADRTRVSCLSNTNAIHHHRHSTEFGVDELFDGLFLSHEMGHVKPDRAAFEHVVEALGVAPEHVLFLDDNHINVEGARAAGLVAERAVGVPEASAILETHRLV